MQLINITLLLTITGLSSAGLLPAEHLSAKRSLLTRATCDVTPSAATGAAQPLATKSVSTAADCQSQCASTSQCQSFVFGTAADGTVECLLYSVPAAQIPVQSGDLKAYDTSCANVPTTAPSASQTTSNTGTKPGQQIQVRDVCGSAPTSTSNQGLSPLQTLDTINSAADCLNLCKQTSGCQSVEFGKTSANGQNQCLLFNVAASELPVPSDGQSLVAYGVGC